MRKTVSILLVICMLFSTIMLASCGNSDGDPTFTSAKPTEPKPTDPVGILRDAFSKENVYEKISEVKKPAEDIKEKVDDIKAVKMTDTIAINKLVVGGNAVLPSPLVLSGEIKTDKKSVSLDGKLSFLGEEIGASLYAATKSGKGLDDDTLEPDDITVFADLGGLYQGYLGFDGMIKNMVEKAKESADEPGSNVDTEKLEEALAEMKDFLDKYFSEEQTRKIAEDISSAVGKAIDAIPENAFVKSTGALTYKDVYTAEGATVNTLTVDGDTVSKMMVAFLTQLKSSTSEFVKEVIGKMDLDKAIENAEESEESETALVLIIASNDEALDVKAVMKKDADSESLAFEAFCKKDGALYADLYNKEGEQIAEAKAVKTNGKCELLFKILGEKPVEFNANIEKKDEDNYTFGASVTAGKDEQKGTIGVTGSISKTGDLKNGSVSGSITLSADIPAVKCDIPVSFKVERNDKKAAVEFKLGANAPNLIEAEIEVKADAEILDSLEIATPDASQVKQLGDDNMMEVLQTVMGNLYQKCPNITLFLAQLSASNSSGEEWD